MNLGALLMLCMSAVAGTAHLRIENNTRFTGSHLPGSPSSARATLSGADVATICAALAPDDREAADCDAFAISTPRKQPPRDL